jgi:hypothetical protein
MNELYNPFATIPGRGQSPYDDESVMSGGARAIVSDLQRADAREARRDPLSEQMTALTQRKTQIGHVKRAAEHLRDTFLENEGSDLFERDPVTGKMLKNPDDSYVPRLGAELESLRHKSAEVVGFIKGAMSTAVRGQPTPEAKEAAATLAEQEPIYKAKLDKFERIQVQLRRVKQAEDETDLELGRFATARLNRDNVDLRSNPQFPQGQGVRSPIHGAGAAGQQPAPATTSTARQVAQASRQQSSTVTPAQLVRIHRDLKQAEDVSAMETTSEQMKTALTQKAARLRGMLQSGLAALPSAELRQRVIERTGPIEGFESMNGGAIAQTGKALVRGGTAEGIFAGGEGLANLARNVLTKTVPDVINWLEELRDMRTGMSPQELETRKTDRAKKYAGRTADLEVESEVVGKLRDYGNTTSLIRQNIRTALEVDQQFAESLLGQVAQGGGQMVGTIAAGAAGGPGGVAAMSIGQIYDEAYQDAKQSGQDEATAHSAAMKYLPAAGLDFLSDQLVVGKLLKPLKGKVKVRDVLKDVLVTGAVEGVTEGAQQLYLNQVAKRLEGYDPDRAFDQEVYDSVLVGAIVGGGVTAGGAGVRKLAEPKDNPPQAGAPAQPQQPTPQQPGDARDRSAVDDFNAKLSQMPGGPKDPETEEPVRVDPELIRELQAQVGGEPVTAAREQPTAPVPVQAEPAAAPATEPVFAGQVPAQTVPVARPERDFRIPPPPTDDAAQATATPEALEGDKINREWTAFSEDSKSLGIPRAEMPQIKAEARGALTQFLKARGISTTEWEILPGVLKPTQAEFSPAKVEKARGFEGGDRAILVSSDGHVVDGHHQWMAKLTDDPNTPMRVIRLGAPIRELLPAIGEFPSVKAAAGATKPDFQSATQQLDQVGVSTKSQAAWKASPTTPAGFVKQIAKAAKLKAGSRTQKFLTDIATRLNRAAPEAFAAMQIQVLSDAEWAANAALSSRTPDSAGAFHQEANTMFIRASTATPETIVNTIVHEAGHFAEKFYLGEGFTKAEWAKLTREQRLEAATAYDPAYRDAKHDVIDDRQARAEWVAMQFARVVRGDTEGMSKGLKAKLEKFLADVRDLVTKWIGDGKLTTQALDAKILEMLRYHENAAPPPNPLVDGGNRQDAQRPQAEDTFEGLLGSPGSENSGAPLPGWSYRAGADTERGAGLNVVRQIYERRGQKPDLETADAIIDEIGVQRAATVALSSDGKDGLDPVLREALLMRAMERATEEATKRTGSERAALLRLVQRISGEHAPDLTEMGQAISMRQTFNRLDNPAGVIDQAVRNATQAQDTALGGKESAAKILKSVKEAADEGTDAAIQEASTALRAAARKVPVSKSVWQSYRDGAAARLLRFVEGATGPAPKASLQEFTDRVVAEMRALLAAQLPDPQRKVIPAAEVIREAIENREKYGDILATVRNKFAEEHGEGSPMVELVDTELANLGLRPYTKRLLDRAIKEAHRSLQTSAGELAKQHFTDTDPQADALAESLVHSLGLTGPAAVELAASLSERAKGIISDARRKALARLAKKHTSTKVTRQVITAVMRAGLLNNMGALEVADLRDAVAKDLKLPRVTAEQAGKLAALSDNVRTADNEMARSRAELRLLEEMRLYRGVRAVDLVTGIWYANALSSPATHLANFGPGNLVGALVQVGSMIATDPRRAPEAVTGFLQGLETGWADAKSIIAKGEGLRDFSDKFGQVSRTLEIADARRDLPGWVPGKGLINFNVGLLRYVGRLMRAGDTVFFHGAKDAYLHATTAKLLAAEYQGPELAKRVRAVLQIAPGAWVKAREQAQSEGWQGTDLTLRVASLIQQQRAGAITAAVGKQAPDMVAGAQLFAVQSTLNQEPEGLAGIVYQGLSHVAGGVRVKGVPVLKPFMMFLKIPTNLLNNSLNLTPLGAARAWHGSMVSEVKRGAVEGEETFTRRFMADDERARLYAQSAIGSLMMATVAAAALAGDDDEERGFDLTAKGPDDYRKRQQLEATGWRPYSLKFGDRWVSYKDSVLLIPLALAGAFVDASRYTQTPEATLAGRLTIAAAKAPRAIFETSMLQGLGELLDVMRGQSSAARMEAFLSRLAVTAQPYVPGTAMLSAIDRTMFPVQREADAPGGALTAAAPFVRNLSSERSDVLGEPVWRSPWDRFSSAETNDPLREMLRDKGVFITTPSQQTKLDGEEMDSSTYREYLRISGERIRQRLTPMVPTLKGRPKEYVERTVEGITRQERQVAKNILRSRRRPVFNPFSVRR